ncbi:MAG: polysaccharide biosynthesis/export family protein, partial [Acidobacteriota bacterium]
MKQRKESDVMRLTLRAFVKTCLVGLFLTCAVQYSSAQQGSAIASGAAGMVGSADVAAKKAQPATSDVRYRIGPGDVLDVRVARAPELSREAVRVDQGGMIRMPMLDVDIPAACLTEG